MIKNIIFTGIFFFCSFFDVSRVFVHSGDVHSGHYVVFIKPTELPEWYKFDDESVFPVNESNVLEENYGCNSLSINSNVDEEMAGNNTHVNLKDLSEEEKLLKISTNAYMLVYIREKYRPEILKPVTMDDVPYHISKYCFIHSLFHFLRNQFNERKLEL